MTKKEALGHPRELMAKDNISLKWEFITPAIAKQYLAFNTNNRAPVESQVQRLASDMRDPNLWLTQAVTIQFGLTGKLIDGQHRLMAIIESGTSHWFLVARGVEDECMYVVDNNEIRRFSQQAGMYGYERSAQVTAVANLVIMYRLMFTGETKMANMQNAMSVRSNRQRMADLALVYPDVLDAVKKVKAPVDGKNLERMLPSNTAAFYYLANKVDPTRADEALQVLRDGQETYENDALVVYRDYRLNSADKGITSYKLRLSHFMTLIRCWNKFRKLEPVKQCKTVNNFEAMEGIALDEQGLFVKVS